MEAADKANSQLALSLPKESGEMGKSAYLSLAYSNLQRKIVDFMAFYALEYAFWRGICIK